MAFLQFAIPLFNTPKALEVARLRQVNKALEQHRWTR